MLLKIKSSREIEDSAELHDEEPSNYMSTCMYTPFVSACFDGRIKHGFLFLSLFEDSFSTA
jgi:hypothetical protein